MPPDSESPSPLSGELPLFSSDDVMRRIRKVLSFGRRQVERQARINRARLELRQAHKNRDDFWIRLGRTAYRLAEAGELSHPELQRAMERIQEQDQAIDTLTTKLSAMQATDESSELGAGGPADSEPERDSLPSPKGSDISARPSG